MRLLFQILLFFLTWFTNPVNATPVFTKVALPSYDFRFSKAENQQLESDVRIGIQNFARSSISENTFSQKSSLWEKCVLECTHREKQEAVVNTAGSFANQIDNTIARLTGNANFSLNGTGKYKTVAGHHPMAKKAFEGDLAYDYKEAFSVSTSELDNAAGIANIHPSITGQQNSLYTTWKNANPGKKLTIDEMADIEIQAMVNVGIPQDIATGWVVKSLEDLKLQGVTEIKNIPWNGIN
jgi:hypothetical protein